MEGKALKANLSLYIPNDLPWYLGGKKGRERDPKQKYGRLFSDPGFPDRKNLSSEGFIDYLRHRKIDGSGTAENSFVPCNGADGRTPCPVAY